MNCDTRRGFFGVTAMIFCVLSFLCAAARPIDAQSLPETVAAIHKARVSTRILFITAHPDDEWSSLLAYLSHGLNADVALLTITRGQGGQNAIGPEQDGELGVVRTSELLAAGEHYGVHQFFTRAPDFGFSKSADQTMKVWDHIALEDMVRVIRTFRPDVLVARFSGTDRDGHGHHQASSILTHEAFRAAANLKDRKQREALRNMEAELDQKERERKAVLTQARRKLAAERQILSAELDRKAIVEKKDKIERLKRG